MTNSNVLLAAEECIAAVFPSETSRPGLRTFRQWQKNGWIPFIKVGHRTFFDPMQVRAALERRFKVHATEI